VALPAKDCQELVALDLAASYILIGSPLRDVLCATAISFPGESAVSRLTGRSGRLQEKPNRCLVLTPISDVICRWEEIFIAVLNPDLSLFIDRNQPPHLIVDAQKLVAFHVSILRIFRHPQLEDSFIPTVRFAAAINRFKGRRLDFRQMVTGVDSLPISVREDEFFIGGISHCFDKFVCFHRVVSSSIFKNLPPATNLRNHRG
jgi:hypothetical protein